MIALLWGVLLDELHIFLNGQTRGGRSGQINKHLLVELEIVRCATTKIAGHQIWSYID
jgi:hypothetical protein